MLSNTVGSKSLKTVNILNFFVEISVNPDKILNYDHTNIIFYESESADL